VKLLDHLLGKGPQQRAEIALSAVMVALQGPLARLEKKHLEPALVRARLGDWVRDCGLVPPAPVLVGKWLAPLDEEGWRRLALLLAAIEVDGVDVAVARSAARHDAEWLVKNALVAVAAGTPLLTLSLLRDSSVRVEELARVWLAALDVAIAGETAAESAERRRRIDYGRLLSEAERAKKEAEERMEELRKKVEEAEKLRAGRSKW
jgi:hypothetical protein